MSINIETIENLKNFSLFEKLDDSDLQLVANYINYRHFNKNDIIITEGTYGEGIFFLIDGKAEAYYVEKQKVFILQELNSGDYFGEIALITKGFRTCYVRAKSKCRLMVLSAENFYKIMQAHPSISHALNVILSERLTKVLATRKKANNVLLLYYSEHSHHQLNHFIDYFKKLTKTYCILNDENEENFAAENSKMHNGYILIKTTKQPSEFFIKKSNHIINFNERVPNQMYIDRNASQYEIEHLARVITHKTVGLALSSGGVPGAAHLTILKTLHENNIPIDYITGSSAGAIYGSCYAFGISIDDVIKRALEEYQRPRWQTALRSFSFGLSGIVSRKYLYKVIMSILGDRKLEDAIIPMAVVASDLYSGHTVVLEKGHAAEAITASCSAPLIVEPTRMGDMLLVDGLVTAPLPVEVLIDKKIDIKIAVPIPQLDLATSITNKSKILAIYLRSRSLMTNIIMNHSVVLADVVIKPKVEGIQSLDNTSIEKALEAGEVAAKEVLTSIKDIIYK